MTELFGYQEASKIFLSVQCPMISVTIVSYRYLAEANILQFYWTTTQSEFLGRDYSAMCLIWANAEYLKLIVVWNILGFYLMTIQFEFLEATYKVKLKSPI